MDRRQQFNERFDEFGISAKTKLPVGELIVTLRQNVKEKIAPLIFGCTMRQLSDFVAECKPTERHLGAREHKVRFRPVNEIEV